MSLQVVFLPAYGPGAASSRCRVYQLLPGLSRYDIKPIIVPPPVHHLTDRVRYVLAILFRTWQSQVVYIQKKPLPLPVLWALRALGRPILFDFDDAIYTTNPSVPSDPVVVARLKRRLEQTLRFCRLVTVGNQYLADYARQFCPRVEILPTSIDTLRFTGTDTVHKGHESELTGSEYGQSPARETVIGWCGGGEQHLDSLRLIIPALIQVGQHYPIRLRLIGVMGSQLIRDTFANLPGVQVDFIDWVEPEKVPQEIAKFDIGVMPLQDNEWNRGKCGLKALEYMALGVPTVVSPVGINREIIEHGVNGFWASSDGEWVEAFSRLIQDRELSRRLGVAGRQKVLQEYSLDVVLPRLATLLKQVANRSSEARLR